MKYLPSNSFDNVWQKADMNWKYSKSYYQVDIITLEHLLANVANCRHNFWMKRPPFLPLSSGSSSLPISSASAKTMVTMWRRAREPSSSRVKSVENISSC